MLDSERIERFVVVECVDHVVPVGEIILSLIAVIADGVGKANDIEPRHRHAFAVVRRFQQLIDQAFIGPRTWVAEEVLYLIGSGREASQVEAEAPREG